MSTFVLTGKESFLGGIAMKNVAHQMAIDYGADAVESTVFADDTHVNKGGLLTFGFSMDCYADFDGVDAKLFAGVGAESPLTMEGNGGIYYLIAARHLTHGPLSGSVGDMAGMNVGGGAVSKLIRGVLEADLTTSTTGTTSGVQQGAVAADQSLRANLHVWAAAGTTLDVVVQSDDNAGFTTPTNRITFSTATGITGESLSVGGSITDDYWRVSYTIAGGSFSFAVSLGIG